MSQPTRPAYVELDGDPVIRPPYQQTKTSLTTWVIAADKGAQQRLLDRAFNEPSGGSVDYRALTGHALFAFADIRQLSSLDPRDARFGHTEEIDSVVWILAGAYRNGHLDHLVFFCPYIWVTNTWAMVAGREVYGFPKVQGWAKTPTSPDDPGPVWADTLVLPEYAPTTDLSRQRVITLSRPPCDLAPASFGAGDALAALTAIVGRLVDLGIEVEAALLHALFGDLFSIKLPMVFLKQFRDVATSDRAAYQAIVEADATVTTFRGAGFLPPGWTLDVQQYASLRVADTLGMAPRQSLDLGFWIDFDFSLDLGREVWRAP